VSLPDMLGEAGGTTQATNLRHPNGRRESVRVRVKMG